MCFTSMMLLLARLVFVLEVMCFCLLVEVFDNLKKGLVASFSYVRSSSSTNSSKVWDVPQIMKHEWYHLTRVLSFTIWYIFIMRQNYWRYTRQYATALIQPEWGGTSIYIKVVQFIYHCLNALHAVTLGLSYTRKVEAPKYFICELTVN